MNMHSERGFTIFFAVLVASLALAIGLAMYDLTVRELALSGVASQSQYAFTTADTGAECALYWDSKGPLLNGVPSVFATSSNPGNASPPSSGVLCNGIDIAQSGTPPVPFQAYPTGWTGWVVTTSASAATTTFTITFPAYDNRCALVQVSKYISASSTPHTVIYSQGFSTCATGATNTVERELKVTY
jgi:hypothetical protein